MNILVAIANYGSKNDLFLKTLLREYATMPWPVHIVVLSNIPKPLPPGVELIVETPKGDPWSFPFAHRKIFIDRADAFDLFIYSEDDTLVSARNIEAFLTVTESLAEHEIAGFIRSERGPNGEIHFPTVHGPFRWDARSVTARGPYTFAAFSNDHSAAYLMTKPQLRGAIRSGGFSVTPHEGRYDLLVTAATDPYTQCGLRKLICISQIDDFVLPHLSNKYVGQLGVEGADFYRQVHALKSILEGTRPSVVLLDGETKLKQLRWSKSYYEPARSDMLSLIQKAHVRTLLSYGCGWGDLEHELVKRNVDVTAVPLDSVVAACAEARGVKVIYDDLDSARAGRPPLQFDCILLTNLLHLVPDPHKLLVSLAQFARSNGVLVASVPNLSQLPVRWRKLTGRGGYETLGCYERSRVHVTSMGRIKRWFVESGMTVDRIVSVFDERLKRRVGCFPAIGDSLLASEFIVMARKR